MTYKEFARKILVLLDSLGINLIKIFRSIPNLIYFLKSFRRYLFARKQIKNKKNNYFNLPRIGVPYICLGDHRSQAGEASGHYFHQDLIIANEIFKRKPNIHFDIGSRVDGFIAHLISFEQKIIIGDIRNLNFKNKYVKYKKIDLSSPFKINSKSAMLKKYESLSCLHVIEHIGLGRYGDQINPLGFINALENLSLLLQNNGILYLSHPCSETRVEFNGHYVFSINYIYPIFKRFNLSFMEIHLIDDQGAYIFKSNSIKKAINISKKFQYGCAIWLLKKK